MRKPISTLHIILLSVALTLCGCKAKDKGNDSAIQKDSTQVVTEQSLVEVSLSVEELLGKAELIAVDDRDVLVDLDTALTALSEKAFTAHEVDLINQRNVFNRDQNTTISFTAGNTTFTVQNDFSHSNSPNYITKTHQDNLLGVYFSYFKLGEMWGYLMIDQQSGKVWRFNDAPQYFPNDAWMIVAYPLPPYEIDSPYRLVLMNIEKKQEGLRIRKKRCFSSAKMLGNCFVKQGKLYITYILGEYNEQHVKEYGYLKL